MRYRRPTLLPRCEHLEDRTIPSALMVTNTDDSGAGSLRQAILSSHNGDTIRFASDMSGQTITLTSGELSIDHNLNIVGPGENKLTIDGNGQSRIFDITRASNVSISDLTIADGLAGTASPHPGEGGGIFDNSGHLALRDVLLKNDEALGSTRGIGQDGTNAGGGGIFFSGKDLMVFDSSFSGDVAQGRARAGPAPPTGAPAAQVGRHSAQGDR